MSSRAGLVLAALALGCGSPPPRTAFARHPDAPAEQDRARSDPRALATADRVFAAAGGEHWQRARQLRWTQAVTDDGAETDVREHVWDRWNGRYRLRTRGARLCTKGQGCNARGDRALVVVLDLYGAGHFAYGEEDGVPFPGKSSDDDDSARVAWSLDTALLCLPFLLREPSARLAYAGTSRDAGESYEELLLSFPSDPARAGFALLLSVDPATDAIARVAVEVLTGRVVAYDLSERATAGGLAFATRRVDLGSGRVTRVTELAVSERVDDEAFEPPLSLRYYR